MPDLALVLILHVLTLSVKHKVSILGVLEANFEKLTAFILYCCTFKPSLNEALRVHEALCRYELTC